MAELELHITSGNVDEAKTMLAQIEREHRDDPQVAAALYQMLYETGVIPGKCRRTLTARVTRMRQEPAPAMASSDERGRPHLDAGQRSAGGR